MQKATNIREDFNSNDGLDSDEATEDAKLCTILWRTITGNYAVQQVDETYHGNASIQIPKGVKFVIRGEYNYLNRLKTPLPEFKSITSNFKLKIPERKGFTSRFDFDALRSTKWMNYGFKLNYASITIDGFNTYLKLSGVGTVSRGFLEMFEVFA